MAVPKEVSKQVVSDTPQFDRGGGSTTIRTVQFYVGTHGPFFYRAPLGEYSDYKAVQYMTDTITSLRRVGALPPG